MLWRNARGRPFKRARGFHPSVSAARDNGNALCTLAAFSAGFGRESRIAFQRDRAERRVLRRGLSTLCRAVFSAARWIAGLDRMRVSWPAAIASPALFNTTSVAAFAAAPRASPATACTLFAPVFAAWAIVCLVLVDTVLDIVFRAAPTPRFAACTIVFTVLTIVLCLSD